MGDGYLLPRTFPFPLWTSRIPPPGARKHGRETLQHTVGRENVRGVETRREKCLRGNVRHSARLRRRPNNDEIWPTGGRRGQMRLETCVESRHSIYRHRRCPDMSPPDSRSPDTQPPPTTAPGHTRLLGGGD